MLQYRYTIHVRMRCQHTLVNSSVSPPQFHARTSEELRPQVLEAYARRERPVVSFPGHLLNILDSGNKQKLDRFRSATDVSSQAF